MLSVYPTKIFKEELFRYVVDLSSAQKSTKGMGLGCNIYDLYHISSVKNISFEIHGVKRIISIVTKENSLLALKIAEPHNRYGVEIVDVFINHESLHQYNHTK